MTPPSRVFLVVLLVAFVAGAGAGIVVDRLLLRAPRIGARVVAQDMSPILDRLALTPAQRSQADSILSRRAPASEAVMVQLADHLRAVADSVDAELRRILTPAQQAKLDSLRGGEPRFMLKRKMITPGGSKVDTLLVSDSAQRSKR